ncbi:MAG: sigma 54-interacting transcriptional regulator, partial [Myxococcota bacterium]|nr:sigma 54-interacting transcriptional regulator [Myxococcota bacterium]
RFTGLRAVAEESRSADRAFVLGGICPGMLEMGQWLRGYENFYCDLAGDLALAEALCDKILELKMQYWEKALDEVGDLSPAAQAKLLRALETHTVRRVGGAKEIDVEVRVLAATNAGLDADSGFRQDLLFRLTGLEIGSGVEIGIAIVVMAITLDRLSQGLGRLQPVHHEPGTPFVRRHPYLLASGAVLAVGLLAANTWDSAQRVPKGWMQNHVRQATDWFVDNALVWTVYDW